MIRLALILVATILFITPVQSADQPKEGLATLTAKLIGGWEGRPCEGNWIYHADGTYRATNFSPGGNRLAGTWQVRWDALPPTLVRTCTASDDSDMIGKNWDVKLVQLDDKNLAYLYSDAHGYPPDTFTRLSREELAKEEAWQSAPDQELAAFQGTWVPLEYEEGGKKVEEKLTTRHIIKDDDITIQVNGTTQDTGKIVIDATTNPKQLYLRLNSGPTHALIYVRAGDHVIYCGNRRQEPLPTAFETGTPKGGEYLMAWKIEK